MGSEGENYLADELSKLIILDDWILRRAFFRKMDERSGIHIADLFASGANN